jgi:hypothetical protein
MKKHFKYLAIKYLSFYLVFAILSFFVFFIIIKIKYIYENFLLHYIALFIHNYFNYPKVVAVIITGVFYFLIFVFVFISYEISMKIVHKIMQRVQKD